MKTPRIKKTILIIDDDRILCDAVAAYLSSETERVLVAHTGADGLSSCCRERPDVVLLDQKLPDTVGHTLCPKILEHHDQTKIIFITSYPSFDNAVAAVRAGAHDYLSKPFQLEELDLAIKRSLRLIDLERVEQLQEYRNRKESAETRLVGSEGGLAETARMIDIAAANELPVLITGETGTGKSQVARSIHFRGKSSQAPFVPINCAALPENLVEAELFGFEKGAFTGAATAKRGLFEIAEGGTLFLDEIGNLSLPLQAKLLSVLEDKQMRRLGGESMRPIQVRTIAATNVELDQAIRDRSFRQDLYYRLNVIRIHLCPLRERRQDIPALCDYFLTQITNGAGVQLHDREIKRLMAYDWPGNVRELKNVLERSVMLSRGAVLSPSESLEKHRGTSVLPQFPENPPHRPHSPAPLEHVIRSHILATLHHHGSNLTQTAHTLKLSISTLKRKLRSYGLR